MADGRLAGRVALITGASRGLGRAVARRFAQEGAEVVAVARTQGALEELDDEIKAMGGHTVLVPEDLGDFGKIDQMGAALFERYRRLDILIANHGVLGTLTPVQQIRPAEWDRVMAVNLTANWRLIRSLDPLLRASDAGRAVFVTTGAVARPRAYWASYAVSKAGLETLAKVYADEVRRTNLRVNLIDPGRLRTRMRAEAFPGEDPASLPEPESVTGLFVDLAAPDCARHGEVIRAY